MIIIFVAHRLRKFYSTPPPSGFYLILLYGTESPFDSVLRRGLVQNPYNKNLLYLYVYFDANQNYIHMRGFNRLSEITIPKTVNRMHLFITSLFENKIQMILNRWQI